MVAVSLGAVYRFHVALTPTATAPVGPGEELCGREQASIAPWQGGVEERWDANFLNFLNFWGIRKSRKFTIDD